MLRIFRNLTPKTVSFDGEHSKRWWKTRDEAQSSAQGYWNQRTFPARTAIAEEIAKLEGASLLEVGCHAGPNLWAAAQLKNFNRIAGIELSPTILDFTSRILPEALNRPVELHEAAADKIPFDDKTFDITLVSAVLLCIGPDDIMASLEEILRVTKNWLILCEPFKDDPKHATPLGDVEFYPNTTYWLRNYSGLLEGRARLVSVRPLQRSDQLGHLRNILVFEVIRS